MKLFLIIMVGSIYTTDTNSTLNAQCGPNALFIYMKLNKLNVKIDNVYSKFPLAGERGHSLLEMSEAALQLGCEFQSVYIRKHQDIDQPIIALVDNGKENHYVVLRPVGNSRHLIQIIDPSRPPIIVDSSQIARILRWTGVGLYPKKKSMGTNFFVILIIILIIAFIYTFKIKYRNYYI